MVYKYSFFLTNDAFEAFGPIAGTQMEHFEKHKKIKTDKYDKWCLLEIH